MYGLRPTRQVSRHCEETAKQSTRQSIPIGGAAASLFTGSPRALTRPRDDGDLCPRFPSLRGAEPRGNPFSIVRQSSTILPSSRRSIHKDTMRQSILKSPVIADRAVFALDILIFHRAYSKFFRIICSIRMADEPSPYGFFTLNLVCAFGFDKILSLCFTILS